MFLEEKYTFAMYFVIEHIPFNRQKNLYEIIQKKRTRNMQTRVS